MMKQVTGYMHGVNFGGWMSHEMHKEEHIARFITEADFEKVAAWGVDHVRIPVDFEVFEPTADGSEPVGYVYLDKALAWCRKYGINMILDLHKAKGFSYESMYNESGLFENADLQENFCRQWEDFARRYACDDNAVAFELLNEVTDPGVISVWNRLASAAIRRIRAIAPNNWIMVGSYWNNSLDAMPALDLPADDKLAYVFHCYDPIMFTHQGAFWVKNMPADYRIDYPRTEKEYAEAAATIGMDAAGNPEGTTPLSVDFFRDRFAAMARMCEERNVSMCCTEYGVIEQASDENVLRWYADIHEAFECLGIGRSSWSYKAMNFGLVDRPAIVDQLVKLL